MGKATNIEIRKEFMYQKLIFFNIVLLVIFTFNNLPLQTQFD